MLRGFIGIVPKACGEDGPPPKALRPPVVLIELLEEPVRFGYLGDLGSPEFVATPVTMEWGFRVPASVAGPVKPFPSPRPRAPTDNRFQSPDLVLLTIPDKLPESSLSLLAPPREEPPRMPAVECPWRLGEVVGPLRP